MSELRLTPDPPRDERIRALRDALAALVPGWHALASDVLGETSRIDWVGRDGDGRCVIALLAEEGEDLGLLARGLAQREWVAARVGDWAQLAPESGLRPEAGVAVVLLAPGFAPATRLAARGLGDRGLRLVSLRFVRNGAGVYPLLEPVAEPAAATSTAPTDPGAGGVFRSGLSPSELDLTPEERAELEGD